MPYKTFVKLDPYERWVLRVLQNMPKLAGKSRKLPANKLIGAVLREYFDNLAENSEPEMLRELLRLGPPCPHPFNDIVNKKLDEAPPGQGDPTEGQAPAPGRPS